TLSRRAGERGTIWGMAAGVAVNLLLWLRPHALSFSFAGYGITAPQIAWTWWVLIGSMVTCAVGYTVSLLFPEAEAQHEEVVEG
ncbi:MAG TPA: hypothetical protein VMD25_06850, partial [Acidobacteriaceae bacterium]|nr:hypothetical protein [Acidobacteriaceae bacterium]